MKYKLKDYIGAISSYDMVIELISEQDILYHMAIFNRGMSYFLQDDDYLYFKAIEDFTSAIELPQFSMLSEAYYFRGAAKYRVFDRDGACEDFKKSKDLGNSSNTEIFSFCAD
ncbi:hypothetical protein OAU54_01995 [Flavobacteriaceae bacterium]|nr:hypothetical protein [Flavobacteriaceae bacterium]